MAVLLAARNPKHRVKRKQQQKLKTNDRLISELMTCRIFSKTVCKFSVRL